MNSFIDFLIGAIPLGMTFLYGCVGEILTEKAGHLNLGIPGIMSVGGACGCLALSLIRNMNLPAFLFVLLPIVASFAGGIIMGGIYCFLTVTLKANQNVTGLAMTTFGVGVTKYIMIGLSKIENGMTYLYALPFFRYPFASNTTSLNQCGVMVFLAIIIAIVCSYVLSHTRVGLHLRATGENPATADAAGINITKYKYMATCIGSGIAALGGLFYIMDCSGSYEAYKSIEALGWLSVALVIFTLWRPHISIFGSVIFGALYIAGTRFPSIGGIVINVHLFKLLPYVVTIIVLIVTSVRNKRENQPPASLGLAYFREER